MMSIMSTLVGITTPTTKDAPEVQEEVRLDTMHPSLDDTTNGRYNA